MELKVIKNEVVPIKAIPEEKLNALILQEGGLSDWLCQILNIKPTEDNVSRLEVLLPMVKEHCWSMPIEEIKKAFLMYVQGKLSIEPIDNYLTAILFGKVVRAYKAQKVPQKAPMEVLEGHKDAFAKDNVLLAYDEWKETGRVSRSYASAFDRLYEWGILPKKEASDAIKKRYERLLYEAHIKISTGLRNTLEKEKAKPGAATPDFLAAKKELQILGEKGYAYDEIQILFRCKVLEGFFAKNNRETIEQLIKDK